MPHSINVIHYEARREPRQKLQLHSPGFGSGIRFTFIQAHSTFVFGVRLLSEMAKFNMRCLIPRYTLYDVYHGPHDIQPYYGALAFSSSIRMTMTRICISNVCVISLKLSRMAVKVKPEDNTGLATL